MTFDGIGSLVLARLRRRPGQWLSIGGAVASAVALIGILAGLSVGATDQAVARALARLDEGERAVLVTRFAPTDREAGSYDAAARSALADLEPTAKAVVAGVLFNRARDPRHLDAPDIQVLAADDLARWASLASGRMPAPCGRGPCEALLVSRGRAADTVPDEVTIAGLSLRIVGRGSLTSALPVGRPDLSAEREYGLEDVFDSGTAPPPAYLLVDGTAALAADPRLAQVGRTYRWIAPLEASAIHPWTAERFSGQLVRVRQRLAATTFDYAVQAPEDAIAAEIARGAVAAGRLELIGALAVAVLIAFAVFAGIVVRDDVALEVRRLRRVGGGRSHVAWLLALEVLLPAGIAAILGLGVAAVVVGWLATASGSPAPALVQASLLSPATLLLVAAVSLGGALAVLAGILFTPRRGFVLGLLPGLLAVGAVVAWQLVAGEGLADRLVRGSLGGPAVVLLPAVLAFFVTGAFLVVVPVALRALARRTSRARLPVRLAILSLARDPARPAATITLLAFSLGALVFAVGYGETVRRGIAEQAAFETGADLRVSEAGTALTLAGTVIPVARYDALGPNVMARPVVRRGAELDPGGAVTLLGVDPASLARLPGWRADFSAMSAADIGAALAVDGDLSPPGHRLAAGERDLAFELDVQGDPVILDAAIATADGDVARVRLGTFGAGRAHVSTRLPDAAVGGTVIAIVVGGGLPTAGPSHPGSLVRATVAFHGLEGLIDDSAAVDVEVGGVVQQVIRGRLATDDMAIPALVSADIAALADPDGTLAVSVGGGTIRLRTVATATRFPTVLGPDERFVVTAYAPLALALDGLSPGAGHPDEMWIATTDVATADRVAARLEQPPFRSAVVRSRAAIEAERAGDPFAAALATADLVTALAGLALAWLGLALGIVADLRDGSGELADLEAQGVSAGSLRALAQARTMLLAGTGSVAGLAVGIALTAVTTTALALAAGATIPVPDLRVVVPWATVALVVAVPLAGAAGLVAVLARRGRWADR